MKIKRLLGIFLAVALLFTMIPTLAFAKPATTNANVKVNTAGIASGNATSDESANDLDSSVNGIVQCPDGRWAMYKNGKVDTTCTSIEQNKYGWWRVKDGYVDFEAQGIYQNRNGWWKTTNGKVTFKEFGLYENENGTWRVEFSKVNFKANSIYQGKDGWYKTTNGKVTFDETGVFQNQFGWWYVKNSKVDFDFTGIASNNFGKWYIKTGKVDFTKIGKVEFNGNTYLVMLGKVLFLLSSNEVDLTRYEWIRMLVEYGGYDLETVSGTEAFFKDVSKDDPYYPYVQIAHMWNLVEDTESFNGEAGADEWFVAQTAMKSLGDTRLQSLMNKEINFNEDELFRQATIHNIARDRREKLVTTASCESRLEALTELTFSEEANQEYQNIKLNTNVVEFSDSVDVEVISEDKQIVWSDEDVSVTPGTIVAYQDKDGFYSAGKVSNVITDGSDKTGFVVESTEVDEIFDTYIARETIDVDIDMVREYFEENSVEDYATNEEVGPSSTEVDQFNNNNLANLLFKNTSDLEVSDLLKRDDSSRMLATASNNVGYEITVKIDSGNIANKVTVSVRDLATNQKYSYIMDPKKFTLDDSLIETETNKKKSVTLAITLKDPKLDVAASIMRSGLKLEPYFTVNASSDISLGAKGNLKGEIEIPVIGENIQPFEFASCKLGVFVTGSLSGEIDADISIPYRMSLDLSESGLKTFVDANASSTLKGVLEGEFGLKPEIEARLLNETEGIKLNANQFVGFGGEADYVQHSHTCECTNAELFAPIAHGSVSADLGLFTKLHAEHNLWVVKPSAASFSRSVHYESYYDGSFEGFVDKCTFENYGTYSGMVYDADNPYEPVPEAEITIYRGEELVDSARSDLDGKFLFDLPAGLYKTVINKSGYQVFSQEFTIDKDDNYYIEVKLDKCEFEANDVTGFEICFDPHNNEPILLSSCYVKSDELADYYYYPKPVKLVENETHLLNYDNDELTFFTFKAKYNYALRLPRLIHVDGSACSNKNWQGGLRPFDDVYWLSKYFVNNLEPGTRHRLVYPHADIPELDRDIYIDFVTE